ncbi:MAG TPA: manganese efflux pump MntP family protein [Bacillota bacterium]|nr:manganese efflux pump MntP family protein [Bacillota bacterium]
MAEDYTDAFISLCFIAVALGADVFSVSLGLGMQRLRLKRVALIGVIFGLFHVFMPFLGMVIGQYISSRIGHLATFAGGFLLVGIGAQMIFSAFSHHYERKVEPVGIGLLFLGFSVSIDSFSVGLSLGVTDAKTVFALLLFGMTSMLFTWIGMLLGRQVHSVLGVYSEVLGGSILCGLGLTILFG